MDTPDTDLLLVTIPLTNNVVHADEIRSVTVRKPVDADELRNAVPPGVVVTIGSREHGRYEVIDCHSIGQAEAVREQIARAWRRGLREWARIIHGPESSDD